MMQDKYLQGVYTCRWQVISYMQKERNKNKRIWLFIVDYKQLRRWQQHPLTENIEKRQNHLSNNKLKMSSANQLQWCEHKYIIYWSDEVGLLWHRPLETCDPTKRLRRAFPDRGNLSFKCILVSTLFWLRIMCCSRIIFLIIVCSLKIQWIFRRCNNPNYKESRLKHFLEFWTSFFNLIWAEHK